MEIVYSIFIGIIYGMIVGMIDGIGLQCRRDNSAQPRPMPCSSIMNTLI